MRERAVVIGLDGFTFSIVDRLVARGEMPAFARLMSEGTRAPLESTVMPNSFPGWTSCATGCNEGKHGIFMPLVRRADNFSMKAMDSTDIRMKTVWEVLGERGHESVVMNDPCSYPPQQVKGCVVSGMTTPGVSNDWTWPESLKAELLQEVPGYVVDVNLYGKTRAQMLGELVKSAAERLKAALYLMGSRDWDLFWVTFTESDRVQHRFWADQQTDHPQHTPEFPTAVEDMYRQLDGAVGELLKAVPDNTRVFIVSDHGFDPFYCMFDVTGWLIDHGFTAQRAAKAGIKRALASVGLLDEAAAMYRKFKQAIDGEARHGAERMREAADEANTGKVYVDVDWAQTRAYATLDGGIRINLRGREPHGAVEPSDARAIAGEIVEKLAGQRFPNGEPVFERVAFAGDVFSGPVSDRGPDIVIPVRTNAYKGPVKGHKYLVDRHRNSGEHGRYGIFVAWGPGIEPAAAVANPRLIDVAPTVLYSLNERPTVEMDGRVLVEVFDSGTRAGRATEPLGSSAKDAAHADAALTTNEELMLEERLRGLGYIE